MKAGRVFELAVIVGTTAAIANWAVGEMRGRHPTAYTSVHQKASDIRRDLYWSAAQYAADLASGDAFKRAYSDPKAPAVSVLRPAPDRLKELTKNL